MDKTKVIFFGSDQYSQIVLDALEADERLQLVYNLDDKPIVGVLASYGKIIPQSTLDSIPMGILNLHPSLLPKYRGPSPVQSAIIGGEEKTGISIMKMDEQIDHGPILLQVEEEIKNTDTAQSLYQRLFSIGAQKLLEILPDYLADQIQLQNQDHQQATFTKKLKRESGFVPIDIISQATRGNNFVIQPHTPYADLFIIDKNPITPGIVERMIRAFSPWPGVWSEIEWQSENGQTHKRIKILKAHIEGKKLTIDEVQLEGKNPVTLTQFCQGYPEAQKYFS